MIDFPVVPDRTALVNIDMQNCFVHGSPFSAGIATNVCCETTAREATVRDFRVFFLSDGTTTFDIGDVSAAELKRATCATLGFLFAQVLTVAQMIRKLPVVTPSEVESLDFVV